MSKPASKGDKFAAYDKATNKKMAEHNREGGDVRKPVRDVSGASDASKYDRGKFLARKAGQALSMSHPLKNDKGEPTPAALQFKRWDAPIPKNRADLQKLKTQGENIKERLAPKLGKK
jgi:hypothetical protein